MSTVQAHRTLVKSPPELWAELSDAESLRRHLEPLGEVRITRLDPETTVAWEGERASGTVQIEPSGWGTRVTLTAQARQAAEPEPPARPRPPEPPTEPADPLPQTTAILGQSFRADAPSSALVRGPISPGRFLRLLSLRRRPGEVAPAPSTPTAVSPPPVAPDPPPAPPEPDPPSPAASDNGEPELDTVLGQVLDVLGAAHHRPFSRG